ncbi:MAG: WD40 repeat domain-containing protein [Alphaproteobacteria bacterium]|nr:WD40 repeat domain-containing protein [Alphaproteobacteria bacterium]
MTGLRKDEPAPLIDSMGARADLDAEIVAFAWVGDRVLVATGDGAVRGLSASGEALWTHAEAHDGAILCAAPLADGLVTGGDDGAVNRIGADGAITQILREKGKWVQAVARHGGATLAAIGKDVVLHRDGAGIVHRFDHPATVEAVAFEPNGRRFAAAHYNGVTLSWASNPASRRKTLTWTGAHLGVAWSKDARFVVTYMQENALHGWRLQDGQHFRMTGYPAKIRSMAFDMTGDWLATSGALEVVCWPFRTQNGPIGQSGYVIGALGAPVSAVACHPSRPICAAGSLEGEVALMAVNGNGRPILVDHGAGARTTALAWSEDGRFLAFGDEEGHVGLIDFAEAMAG